MANRDVPRGNLHDVRQNLGNQLTELDDRIEEIIDYLGAVPPSGLVLDYNWQTSTASADPGSGRIAANAALHADVTLLFISETSANGNNMSAVIEAIDDQDIMYIFEQPAPHGTAYFTAVSPAVKTGAYYTLSVEPSTAAGQQLPSALDNALQFGVIGNPNRYIPEGGIAEDILVKQSATNYDVAWENGGIYYLPQGTQHNDLPGIGPNDHHNQAHLLYGPDHIDVDSAGVLEERHVLAWSGTLFQHEFRMNWRGVWGPQTYQQHDVVYDSGYTMLANKVTTDRAAPQNLGDPAYSLPDVPLWTDYTNESVIFSGHLYSFTETGYFRALRVWAPELTPNTNYNVVIVRNPNSANPIYTAINDPILNEDDWTVLSVDTVLVFAGEELLVYIDAYNSGSDTTWAYNWLYGGQVQIPAPTSGNYQTNNQETVLSINWFDAEAIPVDHQLELQVVPNTIFEISEVGNPANFRHYQVQGLYTEQAGYTDYNITVVDTGGSWPPLITSGVQIRAVQPIPDPTAFVGIPTYWDGVTTPVWAAVTSYLSFDGVDTGADPTNAYGVDIAFQRLTISDDWDVVALSGGGGGGGGSGEPFPEVPDDGNTYGRIFGDWELVYSRTEADAEFLTTAEADAEYLRLDASNGPAERHDIIVPGTGDSYFVFPPGSTSYIDTPYTADLDVPGDFMLRLGIEVSDWSLNQNDYYGSRFQDLQWRLMGLSGTGNLYWYVQVDGGGTGAVNTGLLPTVGFHKLEANRRFSDAWGQVLIDDVLAKEGVMGNAGFGIKPGTSPIRFMGNGTSGNPHGNFYYGEIYGSLDESVPIARCLASEANGSGLPSGPVPNGYSWVGSDGRTWTVKGSDVQFVAAPPETSPAATLDDLEGLDYAPSDHVTDYTNPHQVNYSQTGAAPEVHNHNPFTGQGTTGFVPDPVTEAAKFLRDDGSWQEINAVPAGGVSTKYDFSSSVTPGVPALGVVKVDNADQTLATTLWINSTNKENNDIYPWLLNMKETDIIGLNAIGGSGSTVYYTLTADSIDQAGFGFEIPVTFSSGTGGILDSEEVDLILINNPASKIPAGGLKGQRLEKLTDTNYDTYWADVQELGYKIVTGTHIAESGIPLAADSEGGPFSIDLPLTPSEEDTVGIIDPTGFWGTNNVLIARNGNLIDGRAEDMNLDVAWGSIIFVFRAGDWLINPDAIGTKGEVGDQGATGPQGEQGDAGADGADGAPGLGVPAGGSAGQVLTKLDATDYNTQWEDQSGGYWSPNGVDIYNNNSGNVGIGVTSPNYKLAVAGDLNITGAYYINGVPIGGGGEGLDYNVNATYPSTQYAFYGDTETYKAGGSITKGDMVGITNDTARLEVLRADSVLNPNNGDYRPPLGIALNGGGIGAGITVFRRGMINLSGTAHTVLEGNAIYLGRIGKVQSTKPASGDALWMMGYSPADDILFLDISQKWEVV